MSGRIIRRELLRALVLGALLSTSYMGVGAAADYPITGDTISGNHDLQEQYNLFNLDGNQKVTATSDVTVVSSGTEIENKAAIIDGRNNSGSSLDLNMDGHSLSIESYPYTFYMTSSNHKIDVHDADTISVKAIGRPIMYMPVGSGNEINLQANKDILLTQVKDDFDSPSMSVKGDNTLSLKAGNDIVLHNDVKSNILTVSNKADLQIEAGHDVVFNRVSAEPYIPNLYVERNANATVNAGNDIIFNRVKNATPIGLRTNATVNLKAKGNIIFHEEQASNPVAINMESDADFQMEAQTISGNMQRMTMVAGGSNFNLKADDLQWGAPVGQSVEAVAPKNDPMLTSMISAGRSSTVKLDLGNSAKLANEITGTLLYTNFGSLTMNAGDSIYLHNTGYKSDDKFQSLIRLQGGTIDLTAGEGILLDNKGAIAVLSEYYGEVNFNGKTAINGAGIGAFAPGGGIINFNGNTVMSQVGTGASASESGTINFNGNTVMSQVDIGALTETDSDPWAEELTKINFEDDVVIDQAETGVSASYNSDIVFNKGLSIDAKDNAFYTESAGRIQALATGEDKVIKGNMQALNGQIDVLLDTEKSSFTGATELQKIEKVYSWDDEEYEDDDIIYDDEEDWDDEDDGDDWEMPYVEETPTINLTLKNGAVWNVTGDSTLTNLENDSFVNLSNTDRTGTSLTAQTLSGTGTMVMDLDWNSNGGAKEKTDNSDYLNVTESATGTQALVTDKASMHLDAMGVDDRLYFATLVNSDAVFTSPITQRNVQKGHLYDYIIGIDSETTATTDDTSDAAETIADRAAADTTTDWFFGTVGYTESPVVETGRINSQIMYDLVTDVDTLNKRMGDVRHMNTDPDGWWARTTYTHQDRDSYSGHSNRFELGKDFVMNRADGSTVHQGAVFTYLRGKDSFTTGNGKYNRYSGALYHTWLGNDGRYVDVVGRIGKVMGNSHTFLVNGDQSDSSFGTWYQQASVETGRSYDLKDGWYFEPQAQLQYTHMNSKSYTSSDGINHDLDSVNSFIGRLGFRLGQNINEKTSWYLKGDILHEFSGDGGIMLTSSNGLERINYNRDGKDTWYDLGAGLTTELSPASSLWFEFERKFSGTYNNNWEFNGGISWKF